MIHDFSALKFRYSACAEAYLNDLILGNIRANPIIGGLTQSPPNL